MPYSKYKKVKRLLVLFVIVTLIAMSWHLPGDSGGSQPAYRTDKITRGDIKEVVTATGTLNPVQLVTVGTQVSGQVNKLYVKVNDHVKMGQLLAEIDPALLLAQIKQDRSSLETAKVGYEQAERDLNRTRMLLEKDYVAKVDLEHAQQAELQAKNSYDSAKTVIERDEVNLNYAKIVSPIDGIVISQEVTEGQTLQASFQAPTMFKIAGDLTKMKIEVNFSEADIGKVKVNLPATFNINAFPDRVFTGMVQSVNLNPTNQQGSVTYGVTVTVDNQDQVLLPGMTAYVSVTLAEKKGVLRVLATALRFVPPPEPVSELQRMLRMFTGMKPERPAVPEAGSKTIYLLRHNELVPVTVTVGKTDESYVEIEGAGIAEGDTVVTGIMPPGRH